MTDDGVEAVVLDDGDVDPRLRHAVRALCFSAFGARFSDDDWDHTCGGVRCLLLDRPDGTDATDATDGVEVIGHAAVVLRRIQGGDRVFDTGYVEGVAVRPGRQRRGLGTRLMTLVTEQVQEHFELGALSTGRHSFYSSVGWERWAGPSFVRRGQDVTRTEDEDAGLMVLRFGPSAGVSLGSAITCESRSGDDW
ncbi:MAG: GNAT family N-acetyltransferase [Actinomycetes bacterium]